MMKCDISNKNTYIKDENGYIIGIIGSSKVIFSNINS